MFSYTLHFDNSTEETPIGRFETFRVNKFYPAAVIARNAKLAKDKYPGELVSIVIKDTRTGQSDIFYPHGTPQEPNYAQ